MTRHSRADRCVHAVLVDGREVVRYDRSGKWFVECPEGSSTPRVQINLNEAAAMAARSGARVLMKQPGGRMFDAAYRRLR